MQLVARLGIHASRKPVFSTGVARHASALLSKHKAIPSKTTHDEKPCLVGATAEVKTEIGRVTASTFNMPMRTYLASKKNSF